MRNRRGKQDKVTTNHVGTAGAQSKLCLGGDFGRDCQCKEKPEAEAWTGPSWSVWTSVRKRLKRGADRLYFGVELQHIVAHFAAPA